MILLLLIFSFSIGYAQEIQSKKENGLEQVESEKQELDFVQVSAVTEKSVLVLSQIKEIQELIVESEDILEMQKTLLPYCDSLDLLLKNENYSDIKSQNIRELQKMDSELSVHLKQFKEWKELTLRDTKKYDENSIVLKKSSKTWKNTYDNAIKESAPESLLTHIKSVIEEIEGISVNLKNKYDKSLTDTQTITTKISLLNDIKETLKETETTVSNQVFHQNQAALFSLVTEDEFTLSGYVTSIGDSINEKYREVVDYFVTNSDLWLKFSVVSTLSLGFVGFYNYLYRKKKLFVSRASLEKKIFFFIGRPFATYAILFILGLVLVFTSRPQALSELFLVFMFIPVMRVLQTVAKKEYFKYIYAIFIIYLLQWFDENSVGFEVEQRYAMLLINVMLLVYVGTLVYNKVISSLGNGSLIKIANYFLVLFFFLLIVSIGANIYGSVLLSTRIVSGVLKVFYSAMIFYSLYVILTGYIVVILRRRIASASNMLDKYSKNIESTTRFLIQLWMMLWWLLIVTKTVSLYPLLADMAQSVMEFSFSVSNTTISMQSIIDFVLIVVGTWVLARLVRTVLEVEVFARFRLPRGVPTAVTTTLNYVIIITGTIIAFSSLGVSPQQFALIFGALGVGIGFGLRNIIANFVSGIIMVFERPVQIGDTIEVDKTMGSVQSIGARSSTIKTFDGSEVIIPNADFIAKEIVNWTLSDEHRRKTIELRVDLDNDIDMILKIMSDIATAHKDVLSDPAPLATFKSFGEYYLEFKLYFWLSDNLIVAQSEINIAIYRALKEANVKMPVPKATLEGISRE